MTDDPTQTANNAEPASGSTSADAPGSDSTTGSSSQADQPSYDELQERTRRLEANVQGSTQEWKREKAQREALEAQLNQMRYQQPQYQPQPSYVPSRTAPDLDTEQMSDKFYQAVLDGDKKTMAELFQTVMTRPVIQVGHAFQQAQVVQGRNTSAGAYIQSRGITPGSELFREASARVERARTDPAYSFVQDPNSLAAIVVNEMLAEKAGSLAGAKEKARQTSVDGAFTEGNAKGNLPGQPTGKTDKMFFSTAEMKIISHMQRSDGISEEAAKKKYWDHMAPAIKTARKEAGRAV